MNGDLTNPVSGAEYMRSSMIADFEYDFIYTRK